MTKPPRTEDEADRELEEAVRWYEARRSGLGAELLAAVDITLEQIVHFPATGSPVPKVPAELPVRRRAVEKFPYYVVYLETTSAIRVLAFAHTRRRPGYWLTRTESRK